MSRTFTYVFSDPVNSSLTITTGDSAQAINTPSGSSSNQGFAITGISGTFNGQMITGLYGASGTFQQEPGGIGQDNAIFINAGQGDAGQSFDGIDSSGISFTVAGGPPYNIFDLGFFGINLAYSQPMMIGSAPQQIPIVVQSTNYATAVCFASGTLIRVARCGRECDTAVEHLRVGDLAVTASGRLRPIRWIGHRVLDGAGAALPHDQQPVRVRAGAFGPNLPVRDLRLSPGHPVLVGVGSDGEGGALVPVMCLINGTSIAREPASGITYWHVELDAHDILLAEGLPAESYLDWGDRAFFSDAPAHALANPDFVVPGLAGRCRPVAVDGPVVDAERRRLDAVFAGHLAAMCGWPTGGASLPF